MEAIGWSAGEQRAVRMRKWSEERILRRHLDSVKGMALDQSDNRMLSEKSRPITSR